MTRTGARSRLEAVARRATPDAIGGGYADSPGGRLPDELGAGTPILWGKAKSNWEDDIAGVLVVVYPCDDASGANPLAVEHTVGFPDDGMHHPNVRQDDIIAYVQSGSGYFCVWGAKWQERVGSVKMWHNTGSIPVGWQIADGTNGTRDLRGRFLVGYDSTDGDYSTVGNTGGAKTHTHPDHGVSHNFCWGTGAPDTVMGSADKAHTASDSRPPYYVLVWIERVN